MKTRIYLTVSVSALAVLAAHSAQAQEYYYGFGVEGMQLEHETLGFTSDQTVGSILGGVTVATANGFRYGAELETSLFTNERSNTAGAPVLDDINNITRVRGLAGYDFQNFSIFASLGYAWVTGDLFGGFIPDAEGLSYGIGADIPVTDRISIRIEALRDEVEASSGFYEGAGIESNSLRLGAIVKF